MIEVSDGSVSGGTATGSILVENGCLYGDMIVLAHPAKISLSMGGLLAMVFTI